MQLFRISVIYFRYIHTELHRHDTLIEIVPLIAGLPVQEYLLLTYQCWLSNVLLLESDMIES